MGWLALSILALGAIYFAIHHRNFRRVLFYSTGAAAALVAVGALYLWYQSAKDAERLRAARLLVRPDQVLITDAMLSLGGLSKLTAIVANNSPYEITALVLKVTVTDCSTDLFSDLIPPGAATPKVADQPCGVVGEDEAEQFSLSIPSGQKRAFNASVYFPNLPPLKQWSWSYSIGEITAK